MNNYLYLVLKDFDNNFLIDYFTASEFACKDGSRDVMLDIRLLCILYAIRCHFGKPLQITSAYRTAKYNEKIKGAKKSAHCYGMACDFKINVDLLDLVDFIINNTQCRIGVYDNFIHIDTYAYTGKYKRIFWIEEKGKTNTYHKTSFLEHIKRKGLIYG